MSSTYRWSVYPAREAAPLQPGDECLSLYKKQRVVVQEAVATEGDFAGRVLVAYEVHTVRRQPVNAIYVSHSLRAPLIYRTENFITQDLQDCPG
jgi:hypothetical protein